MDTDPLVRDYLGRLEAAAAALPAGRRAELLADIGDHITTSLAEAGSADGMTVRNVLERLGAPEEIVAAEGGVSSPPVGAVPSDADNSTRAGSQWGGVEIAAVALLCLAWPALLLPYGLFLFLASGITGLVLVWASHVWTTRRKVTGTVCVIALYFLLTLLATPATVQCTTGDPPHACPPGGPSPIVNPTQ